MGGGWSNERVRMSVGDYLARLWVAEWDKEWGLRTWFGMFCRRRMSRLCTSKRVDFGLILMVQCARELDGMRWMLDAPCVFAAPRIYFRRWDT